VKLDLYTTLSKPNVEGSTEEEVKKELQQVYVNFRDELKKTGKKFNLNTYKLGDNTLLELAIKSRDFFKVDWVVLNLHARIPESTFQIAYKVFDDSTRTEKENARDIIEYMREHNSMERKSGGKGIRGKSKKSKKSKKRRTLKN